MRVCIITVSNSEIVSAKTNDTLNIIVSQLYKNGQDIISKQVLKSQSSVLSTALKLAYEQADCVILICENENEKFYMAKNVLCDIFGTTLSHSEYAKKNIDEVVKTQNIPLKKEETNCYQMPEIARTIKNPFSAYQGCLMEKDNKLLFLLPLEHNELHHIFFSSVLPYILKVDNTEDGRTYVLKTFGIKYTDMVSLLDEFIKNRLNIEIVCSEHLLSGEVIIRVPKGTRIDYSQNLIQNVYKKILPYVYSDKDETQAEFIYSLLSIRKQKIALAEDFTAGKMSATLYENIKNAKEVLSEGYIATSNKAKIKLLGVEEDIFKKEKVDYSEIAYEMALGVLENSGADVVAANCGDLESGELVFAIGNCEGIHIFSQVVTGSYEEKIITATNTIFFQLIKKIRQNDFHLGQITV